MPGHRTKAIAGLQDVFEYLGFDLGSQHMEDTAERWLDAMGELTYQHPKDELTVDSTTFDSKHDEMVIVTDIQFVTLCAHHLVPFFGTVSVAYIPDGKIVGLSKIPRWVRYCSRRPNVQEELTEDIALGIEEVLEPKGVAVVLKAEHMCMTIRGVQAWGTKTTTSKMTGVFLDPMKDARPEFLQLIGDR